MRIALSQLNSVVGDCCGNAARVIAAIHDARAYRAELVVFPEQTLLGYPAKDLLFRRELIGANRESLDRIAAECRGIAALVGFAEPNEGRTGRPVFNSMALLANGRIETVWRKRLLPTYDVFDEARYFEPAGPQPVVEFGGRRLGVAICEDMLSETPLGRSLYAIDPVAEAAAAGAEVLIAPAASPFFLGKQSWRTGLMAERARRHCLPILFVNQLGGNDELLFDGAACAIDAAGRVVGQARSFKPDQLVVDLDDLDATRREVNPSGPAELYDALVMGLSDYAAKCGFRSVVLGLSGGIDSAVVACLAAAAVGAARVHGVAMPSRFSSDHSLADARVLAERLGIRFSVIPIEPAHAAMEGVLAPAFAGRGPDVTEENLQARIRGAILMSLSNKFGDLLLTTGNKSEVAVGYCTLYGDMCGGLAVISDVPKTMVYALAREINRLHPTGPIPDSTLNKPPSAELRPNQTDQDSLPPYDVLDEIIERYEEQMQSAEEIIAAGFDASIVRSMIRKMHMAEYKRQQAAPGLKVTSRAFGFGRRMPIAARVP